MKNCNINKWLFFLQVRVGGDELNIHLTDMNKQATVARPSNNEDNSFLNNE